MLLSLFLAVLSPAHATTCDVYPTNTCPSSLATVSKSGAAGKVKVNTTGYQRMDVFAYVCSPKLWVLHLADSPTSDGYGGDASTTDHDAEAYLFAGNDFEYFSGYDWTTSAHGHASVLNDALNPEWSDSSGCYTVQIEFAHAPGSIPGVVFDPDVLGLSAQSPKLAVISDQGPRTSYASASSSADPTRSAAGDWEDKARADEPYWYIGINQVYSGGRTGSGVVEACVVMSTTTSATVSSCL